jgi:hypothetical protein
MCCLNRVVFVFVFTLNFCFAQTVFNETKLGLLDTGKVQVLQVVPDSFPSIELIVRVSDAGNKPIWNLDESGFYLSEGEDELMVTSVVQISKDQSVNLGLVLDHSGSMMFDESQLVDQFGNILYSFDYYGGIVYPDGYVFPINELKKAASRFLNSFDDDKDSISLICFSTQVDQQIDRGNSIHTLQNSIANIEAEGRTAFYDALDKSLEDLKTAGGTKVVVALTDGNDNESAVEFNSVLLKAQLFEIPLYIIGLGSVNQDSLRTLADSTNGAYFYSPNALGIESVYEEVKAKIQSVYGVKYDATNYNPTDSIRNVVVKYVTDSVFASTSLNVALPEEVLDYLKDRKQNQSISVLLGGGVAIGIGVFLVIYRRKNKSDLA